MTRASEEALLDALYGGALDDFLETRAKLVKAAKARGEAALASRLAARRKPQRAAYVLNQLARRRADDVASLADAGRDLARAQRRALRGSSSDELRAAIAKQREVLARVTGESRALLEELGLGDSVLAEIASALRTALVDPAVAAALEEGHLEKAPIHASGFPATAGGDDDGPSAGDAGHRARLPGASRSEPAAKTKAATSREATAGAQVAKAKTARSRETAAAIAAAAKGERVAAARAAATRAAEERVAAARAAATRAAEEAARLRAAAGVAAAEAKKTAQAASAAARQASRAEASARTAARALARAESATRDRRSRPRPRRS